jgi:oligopeptide transport system substrate-binding protein
MTRFDIPPVCVRACVCGFLLAGLTACALDQETNVESGNRDQVLHFGNADEPQELDPHVTTGIPEFQIQHALFEGLVAKHPQTLAIEPGVAEAWSISDDRKTYIFHLRKNARWSNGDPVIARDFVYSWRRALSPSLGNLYAYMFFYVKHAENFFKGDISDFTHVGVRAVDDQTLIVELNAPTPFFLQLLDHHSYFPVHRATIERFGASDERGTRWTRPGNFVGNGPFVLKEWVMNRIVVVVKNPYYWDADRVRLKEIRFYPIQNRSTEERMFRAGQLHITEDIPIDKIASYQRDHPAVVVMPPWLGTYFYRFNTTLKPLDDVRVRRALALSLNREQIVNRVAKGGQIPAYTFTPPDTNGYTSHEKLPYDVEQARQLLADAGYPDGNGFPVLELMFNTDEKHRQIATAVQEMWKQALNIHVSLTNLDWKVYLDKESRLDYQISRAGWIGDYLDPINFLDLFVTDGGNNRTGWSNPQYDKLLQQAMLSADQNERYAILRQAEKILMQEVPVVPIYTYTRPRLISESVRGWEDNILDQHPYKYLYLQPRAK